MEASALAQQVSKLALSISGVVDEKDVAPSDKSRALDALIELRRLEQLKAIAQGSGNSTYFFGDKPIFGNGAENGIGLPGAYYVDYAEQTKAALKNPVSHAR